MFKMHELREIIKLVDQSSLNEFEMRTEETRISIKRSTPVQVAIPSQPTPVATAKPIPVEAPAPKPTVISQPAPIRQETSDTTESLHKIVSPMVGTFYAAPAEDAPPYVKSGDVVEKTTVVCIVEAMKLFNEIEADVRGKVVEVLVKNGQLVEQGQPLFLVKP
ncbi:acetyl-CoA carboxylase biotin carboxyl carrier protein [Ammoniphilus sp. YIM 78166]|uniref:acetyl-CoA carboxylase biotin carboxyl carrier protein n=1 Tax=Ammoniphilus sp. YIM 78166 TaxID=1644106 RepID=UPI00106FCD32|nr:acetyl-CoA carboxylase biotin carboxyl carrier protein [Ammoniphilus sp. YIM 78166]